MAHRGAGNEKGSDMGNGRQQPKGWTEDRTYGVEIECYMPSGMGRDDLAVEITSLTGIEVVEEGYNHSTRGHWKVVSDGSLGSNRGAEIVSPPLAGEVGLGQIETICNALNSIGCTVNRQCGLHVHHDVMDYELYDFVKLAQLYVKMEGAIDGIMPPSRRSNVNSMLRSVRQGEATVEQMKLRMQNLATARTPEHVSELLARGDRYRKFNLSCYRRQGTVEFRQHNGTTEADKVIHWVKLTQAMVEESKHAQFWRAQGMDNFRLLMGFCEDKDTKKFYRARYRHFLKQG